MALTQKILPVIFSAVIITSGCANGIVPADSNTGMNSPHTPGASGTVNQTTNTTTTKPAVSTRNEVRSNTPGPANKQATLAE